MATKYKKVPESVACDFHDCNYTEAYPWMESTEIHLNVRDFDGHRNEVATRTFDLCPRCQQRVAEFIRANRRKKRTG